MTISSHNPKAALYDAIPQMKTLSSKANPTMKCAEDILMERELDGLDTSWARTILDEAEWRINCTSD